MNNIIEIIDFMGNQGIRFSDKTLNKMIYYISKMIEDKRVIAIYDEGLYAIMFFSIGDSYEPFWKKETWQFLEQNPKGNSLYIEKIVCKRWKKEIRLQMEDEILKLYPKLIQCHWHRFGKTGDRQVFTKRRSHAIHN